MASSRCLATVSVQCEYLSELYVFDEVVIRMRLGELTQSRITLLFEYWRAKHGAEELIARGQQQVACLRRDGDKLNPTPVPKSLREALGPYGRA